MELSQELQTRTELHTHLIGMLSSKGFIELYKELKVPLYLNDNLEADFENGKKYFPYDINLQPYENQISIIDNQPKTYEHMEGYYEVRSLCLKRMAQDLVEMNICDDYNQAISFVFCKYLQKALKELEQQSVEYVEISYSNLDLINNMMSYISGKTQIKCHFLLCTLRSKSAKNFRRTSSNELNEALSNNVSIGFDINGTEYPLKDSEKQEEGKESIKRKIKYIVSTLINYDRSTLRIHSGETPESFDNTEFILEKLEEIQRELQQEAGKVDILPPPEIRIGHGIYFRETQEYVRLLKKFAATIEINATSNYLLGNINNYSSLPYEFYINNNIPIVLSTDGHGLYNTTIRIEDEIALRTVRQKYIDIIRDDKTILEGKRK